MIVWQIQSCVQCSTFGESEGEQCAHSLHMRTATRCIARLARVELELYALRWLRRHCLRPLDHPNDSTVALPFLQQKQKAAAIQQHVRRKAKMHSWGERGMRNSHRHWPHMHHLVNCNSRFNALELYIFVDWRGWIPHNLVPWAACVPPPPSKRLMTKSCLSGLGGTIKIFFFCFSLGVRNTAPSLAS